MSIFSDFFSRWFNSPLKVEVSRTYHLDFSFDLYLDQRSAFANALLGIGRVQLTPLLVTPVSLHLPDKRRTVMRVDPEAVL